MSKKHYEALAKCLRDFHESAIAADKYDARAFAALVKGVCDMCAEDNNAFERAKFTAACYQGLELHAQ